MKIISFKKDRFAIADDTGKIVDDCQGYGFKTKQKAYAYWAWKNRTPEQIQKEKDIEKWLKANRKFCDEFFEEEFRQWKDVWGTDEEPGEVPIEAILKELNLECPYSIKEIKRGLRKLK